MSADRFARRRKTIAVDDARYLARREGQPAWTVASDRPGHFENITAADFPEDRRVVAGWMPDGTPIDVGAERDRVKEQDRSRRRWARESKERERDDRKARAPKWGDVGPRYPAVDLEAQIREASQHWAREDAHQPEPEPQPQPQPQPEPEHPAPTPEAWHVYRPTENGRLWAAGTRLKHSTDPEPIVGYRSANWIGSGTAISWETHRGKAQKFGTRGKAERWTLAQGWTPDQIRVIPATAEPSTADRPPAPMRRRVGAG